MKKIVVAVMFISALAFGLLFAAPGLDKQEGNPVSNLLSALDIQQLLDKGSDAADDAKNQVVNQAFEASGIKNAVEDKLRGHVEAISAVTGMDEESINAAIDELAIQNWTVATLPASASEQQSMVVEHAGSTATLTLYDDPNYMTVEAYGQKVTLEVPESAQQYLPYLGYLSQD